MEYIFKGRGQGKTTEIVKEVIANNGILACFDQLEVTRLERVYPQLRGRIYSFDTLRQYPQGHPRSRKLYVDNADILLRQYFKYDDIAMVSMTDERKARQ